MTLSPRELAIVVYSYMHRRRHVLSDMLNPGILHYIVSKETAGPVPKQHCQLVYARSH